MGVQNSTRFLSASQDGRAGLIFYTLGMIVWPFGFAMQALRNWKSPWSRDIFWIFCIFFGFTFIVAQEGGPDSAYYAGQFTQFAKSDLGLKELWRSFYVVGTGNDDIASPIIIYLVSRVTNNTSILFAVFGLIFGYFYSRNIWYILERLSDRISPVVLLFIVSYALLNPIWNINGFRFNTASQIFLFGALPFIFEGKKSKLIWVGVSFLFHFSFLFAAGVIFLYAVFRNRLHLYMIFFIVSALIREIDLEIVRSALSFLPDIFQGTVTNYTNIEYAQGLEVLRQDLNWYFYFLNAALRWALYASAIYIYVAGRNVLREHRDLTSLFSFALLLYGFANLLSHIPSGGRFTIVASAFMLALIIFFFNTAPENRGMNLIKLISIPLLSLFCIVNIRMGMDFFSIITVLGNPLTAIFYTNGEPFIELLKSLL